MRGGIYVLLDLFAHLQEFAGPMNAANLRILATFERAMYYEVTRTEG